MDACAFPKEFIWGCATSAYQIEGAVREGGRGESIWDRFCATPGNILNGDTGATACDHYHRYPEDIRLMRSLGLKAYRLSFSWPRILPAGRGWVNDRGLAFYDSVIDGLLEAGIEPYVTLYHWDLPQALQDIGGWTNPDIPRYFADYASRIFEHFKGRIRRYITLNEPYCSAFAGHFEGRMAPGLRDFSAALLAAYRLYVGHGLALRAFREGGYDGEIGIALNLMGRLPLTQSDADRQAAIRADGYLNRWFVEPIALGQYPQDMLERYRSKGVALPPFTREEVALIAQPPDFIGLNYYNDQYVRANEGCWPLGFAIENPKDLSLTGCRWPVTEDGLTAMLLRLKREYGFKRILITENGAAYHDEIGATGEVEDAQRVDYLRRHLRAVHSAIEQGAPVRGYFLWSLLDNFEWASGYASRFGIVYVDYATQRRIVKQSGWFYADVIRRNAL